MIKQIFAGIHVPDDVELLISEYNPSGDRLDARCRVYCQKYQISTEFRILEHPDWFKFVSAENEKTLKLNSDLQKEKSIERSKSHPDNKNAAQLKASRGKSAPESENSNTTV